MLRRGLVFVAVAVGLVAVYEGYKWIWETAGFTRPFVMNDRTMPHTWDIVGRSSSLRGKRPALIEVLDAALFTAKEAVVGFALGAIGGFLIAVVLVHSTSPPRVAAVHRRLADDPDPGDRAMVVSGSAVAG